MTDDTPVAHRYNPETGKIEETAITWQVSDEIVCPAVIQSEQRRRVIMGMMKNHHEKTRYCYKSRRAILSDLHRDETYALRNRDFLALAGIREQARLKLDALGKPKRKA